MNTVKMAGWCKLDAPEAVKNYCHNQETHYLGGGNNGDAYLTVADNRVIKLTWDKQEVAACILAMKGEIKSKQICKVYDVQPASKLVGSDDDNHRGFIIVKEYVDTSDVCDRHEERIKRLNTKLKRIGIYDTHESNVGFRGNIMVCFDYRLSFDSDYDNIVNNYINELET